MNLPGLAPKRPQNECRFHGQQGHVESYFLRANDPQSQRALWIKATILSPLAGDPVAESWFIWFDGDRTFAHRDTFPFGHASFVTGADGTDVAVGPLRLSLRDEGSVSGKLSAPAGSASFELGFQRGVTRIAQPLSCYPFGFLEDGPFPKSKFNTPFPFLRLAGQVTVQGKTVSLDGWTAAQGHNWGHEHHRDYAWAQCLFPASGRDPEAMVEGGSGRIELAGRMTPLLSVLVVRRGDAEYRFDSIVDLWRQEPRISRERFTLRMRSRNAEARLRIDAHGRPMACLGYPNPDGAVAYCLNTKVAEVLLEVHPRGEPPFTCRSAHAGALEFFDPAASAGRRRDLNPRGGAMRLSFVETMRGTLKDPAGIEQPISFDVSAKALGGGRFRLEGLVFAPPWAPQAPAEGTLVMSPLKPAMTYQLKFTARDGELLTLDAEKHPTPFAPVRSMTEMEATLSGAGGRELASGRMTFDLVDLVPFLRSWLPLSRSQLRRLDVRRRAVARQLLQGS